MDRRHALSALAAAAAALALPSRAARADAASRRRFVFVFAEGGWDPLCAFAPLFDRPDIEMCSGSRPMRAGGLDLVDHPDRPSVRAFFERCGRRAVLFNGVNVRSVSHDVCKRFALTGRSSDAGPDWASRLAAADQGSFSIPHLALSGPVFAGPLGAAVARAGTSGQLAGLVRGDLLDTIDAPPRRPGAVAERMMDRFHARRVEALRARRRGASAAEDKLLDDLAEASARAAALKDGRDALSLDPGADLSSQVDAAAAALAQGIARCVSLGGGDAWDTHVDSDAQQGRLFEDLFTALDRLVTRLAETPGPSGAALADETVIVVASEMARTPRKNGNGGRDHWPFTSALLVGPGLRGGRVVGGYDGAYRGLGVDLATGAIDPAAPPLTAANLGATILALGGAGVEAVDGAPVTGILA